MVGRYLTGIPGFDEMLGGGIPKGQCILLCGGPGTGKTIFSTQFLVEGIRKYGEAGVFVTLDERVEDLKENMLGFGWKLEELEKLRKLFFVDFSPIIYFSPEEFKKSVYGVSMPEFTIESAATIIKNQVEALDAKRVVIDSITPFIFQDTDPLKRRRNISHLFRTLLEMDCTTIMISEIRASLLEREFQFEEYLAQGVVVLQAVPRDGEISRMVYIEKMRGIPHDNQPRNYRITEKGIEIYPKERAL